MELDYIENVNEFGENIVRLYNFDKSHAIKFRDLIKETIITKKQKLDLRQVDFIEQRNCNLILGLFKTDEGIVSNDNETFYCALTLETYNTMLKLLEPFCKKDIRAHQFLYDIDNPIDFLFCPTGTW